jgi:hypothetical protein
MTMLNVGVPVGGESRVSTFETPAAAVRTAPAAVAGPTLPVPNGYVVLDDGAVLARMLADDDDIAALLAALRKGHTLDAGGPLMAAFTRASTTVEMLAIEIRHIRNLLGGK